MQSHTTDHDHRCPNTQGEQKQKYHTVETDSNNHSHADQWSQHMLDIGGVMCSRDLEPLTLKTFILAEPLCEVPKRYLQRGSAKINWSLISSQCDVIHTWTSEHFRLRRRAPRLSAASGFKVARESRDAAISASCQCSTNNSAQYGVKKCEVSKWSCQPDPRVWLRKTSSIQYGHSAELDKEHNSACNIFNKKREYCKSASHNLDNSIPRKLQNSEILVPRTKNCIQGQSIRLADEVTMLNAPQFCSDKEFRNFNLLQNPRNSNRSWMCVRRKPFQGRWGGAFGRQKTQESQLLLWLFFLSPCCPSKLLSSPACPWKPWLRNKKKRKP